MQVRLRVMEVRKLLFPDRKDDGVQFGVAALQKMQLIVEVAMHGGFHGRRTDPNALPSQ